MNVWHGSRQAVILKIRKLIISYFFMKTYVQEYHQNCQSMYLSGTSTSFLDNVVSDFIPYVADKTDRKKKKKKKKKKKRKKFRAKNIVVDTH